MWRVLVLGAMLCGCSTPTLHSKLKSDAAQQPMISMNTMVSLVAFAVKDRVCRDVVAKSLREVLDRYKDYAPMTPIPRVHSYDQLPGVIAFDKCIYSMTQNITVCNATAEDLSTFKTLMDFDPRLTAVTTFKEVVGNIHQRCFSGMKISMQARIASWPQYKLRKCNQDGNQPTLIAASIHIPINNRLVDTSNESLWDRARTCRSVWGMAFVSKTHCRLLNVHNQRLVLNGTTVERNAEPLPVTGFSKLGIEEYFCPDEI
jgi:hypothetical protein